MSDLETLPGLEMKSEECLTLVERLFDGETIKVGGKDFKLNLPQADLDARKEFLNKAESETATVSYFQSAEYINQYEKFRQEDNPPTLMVDTGVYKKEKSLYGGAFSELGKRAADRGL